MNKIDFYRLLNEQASAIISDEPDIIANMSNLSALLFDALDDINWVGFYRVIDNELVLGPFQGKVACIRIPVGRGVCGTAVASNETQRVDDVHQFSGHIACDAASNSEIVIPLRKNDKVIAVLDIDSPIFSRFTDEDQLGLEAIVSMFEKVIEK
ncbi:GAF domain-containing protein [Colwelliaceae bacterium 6471]